MEDFLEKCRFFQKKDGKFHIICVHIADRWDECLFIEVEEGKVFCPEKGSKQARERIAPLLNLHLGYDEISKEEVPGIELQVISEVVNDLLK